MKRELFERAVEDSGIWFGKFVGFEMGQDDRGNPVICMRCDRSGKAIAILLPIPAELQYSPSGLREYLADLKRRIEGPQIDLSSVTPDPELAEEHLRFEEGYGDEGELVEFIERSLLSEEQRKYLNDNEISVSAILNGNIPAWWFDKACNVMFPLWNALIGKKVFRY